MDLFRNISLGLERKSLTIVIGSLLAIIGAFFFFRTAFFIVLLILLNLAGGFFVSRQRMVLSMFGFEFVTFSTIFAGFAFGPVVGAIIGVIGRLAEAISMKHNFSLGVTVPLYAVLGVLSGLMHPASVVSSGIILAIAFALISSLLTFFILSGKPLTMVVFTTTQIIFSVVLITYLFPIFFTLVRI